MIRLYTVKPQFFRINLESFWGVYTRTQMTPYILEDLTHKMPVNPRKKEANRWVLGLYAYSPIVKASQTETDG